MSTSSRIVSLDPTSHGFGFVVFEEPNSLIDWGHAHVRPCTDERCIARIAELLAWYVPNVVILEDCNDKGSRRRKRVRALLDEVARFSSQSSAEVAHIARRHVLDTFAQHAAFTKDEIARVVVSQFPELEPKLPPPRKIWMSEDERMSIFDATAMLLTYCHEPGSIECIEA